MAKVIGQSGAYRQLLAELRQVGLPPHTPSQLPDLLEVLKQEAGAAEAIARAELDRTEAAIVERLSMAELLMNSQIVEYEREAEPKRNQLGIALAEAEKIAKEVGPFWRNLFSFTSIWRWWKSFNALMEAENDFDWFNGDYARHLRQLRKPAEALKDELSQHRLGREDHVARRVSDIARKEKCVRHLMEEGQQAGAAAELEVIDRLSQLSDDWFVLSDVRLEAEKWHYYIGGHLRSAQVDHVLVGPGGIFVIETKNWSRGFAESGDYFDPFIQVGRASHLCHVLLRRAGLPSRTRSIIATRGHLPENKVDLRAKVLRPEGMVGYVKWFGSQLAPNDADRVFRYLEQFLPRS